MVEHTEDNIQELITKVMNSMDHKQLFEHVQMSLETYYADIEDFQRDWETEFEDDNDSEEIT